MVNNCNLCTVYVYILVFACITRVDDLFPVSRLRRTSLLRWEQRKHKSVTKKWCEIEKREKDRAGESVKVGVREKKTIRK